MIEQLLLRIAKRGPAMTKIEQSDAHVPAYASVGNSSMPFPASLPPESVSSTSIPSSPLMAWMLAKDDYYSQKPNAAKPREWPAAFAHYTKLHAMIGSLIWYERPSLRNNIVHIVGNKGYVVAAVFPSERTVAVRKNPTTDGLGEISLKHLPATASPFDAHVASQFEYTTPHMLIWYFGQVMPEAIDSIPNSLMKSKLLLRKLPLVNPNALNLGHLHLIHLFSAGPIYLHTLLGRIHPEFKSTFCADIASLYLTGCLVAQDNGAS
jgi:hypothetical protein